MGYAPRHQRDTADGGTPAQRARRLRAVLALEIAAVLSAGGLAAAAWTIGVAGGSNGEAQSAAVSNLTVAASASPAATNVLYPGSTGDVVVTISNPNAFPVTLSAVNLPANTVQAGGFLDSALSSAATGCSTSTSTVTWNYATSTSGTSHTLTTPLVIAAHGSLVATLTNDASMGSSSPAACEGVYFSMPALTGVTAVSGGGSATASPTTDAWTS